MEKNEIMIIGTVKYENDLSFWKDQYLIVHELATKWETYARKLLKELDELKPSE